MELSNSVYISYSWKVEDRNETVERLLAACAEQGIEVKRDVDEIGYGDPIRKYMDELAAGGAIILVLSDPYFKSPNCMYELLEIYNHDRKKFRERIFPVVLKGTRFHKASDRLLYIRFWEEETKKLNSSCDDVSRINIGIDSHKELRKYAEVSNKIDDLLSLIGDMNHLTEEEHLKNGFSALIERLFSQPAPDGGDNTDKTGPEQPAGNQAVDIDQGIIGSGNISSGTGNIAVENFNFYAGMAEPLPKETSSPKAPVKLGTLFGVPDPPPNHFERPKYLNEIRTAVLHGDAEAVGITGKPHYVGVQGMGGLGKSVLAAALAHDEDIQAAFPDGIFWLRFRQDADEAYLLEQQSEILKILAPDQLPDTLINGEYLLTLALEDRHCLFIVDDIWDSRHLRHFVLKSRACCLLLTTRNAEVIRKVNAVPCELGLLTKPQARAFLALCSGCAENALPEQAAGILHECGRLPLAVAAIGNMVKGNSTKRWQVALEKLQNARLDKIPADLTLEYEYKNLFKVFEVSVEDLPPEVQAYYKTLLVFPEDTRIHESMLQLYWEHLGQEDYEPLDAIDLLLRRSLLSRTDEKFVTQHDLLRDYLAYQADGDTSELHKQLLDTYAIASTEGWDNIPYWEHWHFYTKWFFHVQESGETTRAYKIADALIRQQPLLNMIGIHTALKFVDYELADIASHLVKTTKRPDVLAACLRTLGFRAKEDAQRLLKKSNKPAVISACLNILGDEAKEDARILLKESQNSFVLAPCLTILGEEAKEDARCLLKKSQDSYVLRTCLKILKDEAREEAWRLLKESQDDVVLSSCLQLLGKRAKKIARHLLGKNRHSELIVSCLNILEEEAKEDAKALLKENDNPHVQAACLKAIGMDAKDDAKRLLKETQNTELRSACLLLLGDEAKEKAREFLNTTENPSLITACLTVLNDDAKDDAKYLLQTHPNSRVVTTCLQVLGGEAKEEARCFLKESQNSYILRECMRILGNEAKKDARRLLKSSENEYIMVACIENLGEEAKAEAERLMKNSNNRFIREECEELICSWDTSIGGLCPELALFGKSLAEK